MACQSTTRPARVLWLRLKSYHQTQHNNPTVFMMCSWNPEFMDFFWSPENLGCCFLKILKKKNCFNSATRVSLNHYIQFTNLYRLSTWTIRFNPWRVPAMNQKSSHRDQGRSLFLGGVSPFQETPIWRLWRLLSCGCNLLFQAKKTSRWMLRSHTDEQHVMTFPHEVLIGWWQWRDPYFMAY